MQLERVADLQESRRMHATKEGGQRDGKQLHRVGRTPNGQIIPELAQTTFSPIDVQDVHENDE